MTCSIALFQPDIAGNAGTILRLGACLGFSVHIIEPAGFHLSDRNLKRAAMDYLKWIELYRHDDWHAFIKYADEQKSRIVAFTTKSQQPYFDFHFHHNDILLFGRESAGLPAEILQDIENKLTIPMRPNMRSLNLAMSVAMATGEVQRQFSCLK